MSKVYECVGRKANNPFFLEKICCNIYSIEELIFCVYENAELLEKDIFTEELADWICEECGNRSMSERMHTLVHKEGSITELVDLVLSEMPFLSESQKERFLELLDEEGAEIGYRYKKKRGDYFLHKGRYTHALCEYEAALSEIAKEDVETLGSIYHNMGMARAGLFLLDQAKEDFYKAYETDGKAEHYYYYAAAMRFCMSEGEYIRTISEDVQMREVTLMLEKQIQEADEKWKNGPEAEFEDSQDRYRAGGEEAYGEWLGKTISGFKEEYRRCIG